MIQPRLRRIVREFLGFGAVGVVGYAADALALYAVMGLTGPYAGRAVSYLCAATVTFALNRRLVFRARTQARPLHREWLAYLAANLVGAALNIGVYSVLVASGAPVFSEPWAALAVGSLAGCLGNFVAVRRYVLT